MERGRISNMNTVKQLAEGSQLGAILRYAEIPLLQKIFPVGIGIGIARSGGASIALMACHRMELSGFDYGGELLWSEQMGSCCTNTACANCVGEGQYQYSNESESTGCEEGAERSHRVRKECDNEK